MAGDTSARRGALPIKRRLTSVKWLTGVNYSSAAITSSSVAVFPCAVTGSPPGTGEAPD